MSNYEIPTFHSSIEADRVVVAAEEHVLEPTVLFEMLSELSLRGYNIRVPKEENLYIERIPDETRVRQIKTELDLPEAYERTSQLITDFQIAAKGLQEVSRRQYWAFVLHSKRRAAEDEIRTT